MRLLVVGGGGRWITGAFTEALSILIVTALIITPFILISPPVPNQRPYFNTSFPHNHLHRRLVTMKLVLTTVIIIIKIYPELSSPICHIERRFRLEHFSLFEMSDLLNETENSVVTTWHFWPFKVHLSYCDHITFVVHFCDHNTLLFTLLGYFGSESQEHDRGRNGGKTPNLNDMNKMCNQANATIANRKITWRCLYSAVITWRFWYSIVNTWCFFCVIMNSHGVPGAAVIT